MARITLVDKWSMHGFQYDKDTKKIYCDPLHRWINKLLPYGTNGKIGKAATWSMKHGDETVSIFEVSEQIREIMEELKLETITFSCPFHCPDCYCDNGHFNWESNSNGYIIKLILAKLFPEWLERAIKAQIEIDNIRQVRIHVSGDFFSIDYVQMWVRIANYFGNDVIFWTYTKYDPAVKAFENIDNVFLVPSITPMGFNFGTCKELIYRYNKLTAMGYRVHICACGTDYEKHCADCKHGCKAVGGECDFVLFIKHSCKDYKAGKDDPVEFKIVCDIIAKQNN